MKIENFQAAKEFLYIHTKSKKYNLFKITLLLEELDNIHLKLPAVHIVGTNGKGSVSSTLAASLHEFGYRVGLFTSPHLTNIRERIVYNGRWIDESEFQDAVEEVSLAAERVNKKIGEYPTFFELIYATALVFFYKKGVDLVVLEAGLGGRYDATNRCNSILTLITRIGLDHRKTLGGSLLKISREKAAVIRRGGYVISGKQKKVVRDFLSQEAREKKAKFFYASDEISGGVKDIIYQDGRFYQLADYSLWPAQSVKMALLGKHQIFNAQIVLKALQVLKEELGYSRIDLSSPPIAFSKIYWPGRLEIHESKDLKPPYRSLKKVIFDGAHNSEGMLMLKEGLHLLKVEKMPVLFGMLRDKKIADAIKKLSPLAESWFISSPDSPRAISSKELARKVRKYGKVAYYNDSMEKTLTAVIKKGKSQLLICGSLYLVGEYRKILLENIPPYLWKY